MTRIWVIDDTLSRNEARALLGTGHDVLEVTSPDDDNFADALEQEWDLILVDEELWPQAARTPPSVVDGSSLVASIRAWARLGRRQLPGIVILTNMTQAFADEPPAVGAWRPIGGSFLGHEAEIGSALDVEWLLTKHDAALRDKVDDLAASLVRAREIFGAAGISFAELRAYLGVPDECRWEALAEAALRSARPPVTEAQPGGETPLRGPATVFVWLLQRALPFPGLFVSDEHAAVFLSVKPEALDRAIQGDAELAACVYKGPLSRLFPRRWWSPGLDDFAAHLEQEDRHLLSVPGLTPADEIGVPDPVVVYDATLSEVGICPLSEAVRLRPPGWPVEAFQPWMRRSALAAAPGWTLEMVDPQDRGNPGP